MDMEELEIKEPHLPGDFKLILLQLEKVIEIYHELIMAWTRPAIIYHSKAQAGR